MSSFEIGASRPVGAVQLNSVTPPVAPPAATPAAGDVAPETASTAASPPAAQVETSDAVKAGESPIDANRVELIRKAIEKGDYPVIPTKISDAMIAAGMILRSAQ